LPEKIIIEVMKKKLLALIIFGVAFAFVEAAVVYYLRIVFSFSSNYMPSGNFKEFLNLGFIAFLSPGSLVLPSLQITHVEALREIATLIMLASVSYLAGKNLKGRFAAFLISFATWDIFYYVFLRYLTGWPKTLSDIDVYFIIPVAWIGPVITPIVISLIMFGVGVWLYKKT
jgi:hypothetical protein